MAKQTEFSLSISEFAESFLYLNGKPYSLKDYPHMVAIYNSKSDKTTVKTSRQVSKSTTIANSMISRAVMIKYFKGLYVAPRIDQTKLFSHDRVATVLDQSPLLRDYYISVKDENSVFTKQFSNGSKLFFRYAFLSPDAIRGITATACFIDEVQDINIEFIPIIEETMFRSETKTSVYTGTPKHSQGTLSQLWRKSTMNEYALRCEKCNNWNILMEENIGLLGPICSRCGGSLKGAKGQWVSTFPNRDKLPKMNGFRICAMHFYNAPWVKWERDLVEKRDNSPTQAVFYNETLGLEYDSGTTPISELELQAACGTHRNLQDPDKLSAEYPSILGIDYGPINSENSNTVLVAVQKRENKYYVTFAKKYLGKEADYAHIHKDVPRLMDVWNASHLAADYGMGEAANSEIRSRVGFNRVIAFQHNDSQKEPVKWNEKMPAYTLNRSNIFNNVFSMIKKQEIVFPMWDDFKPFAQDILNILEEANEDKNTRKFINTGPDDFFHALCYAIVALKLKHRDSNIS